MLCKHGNIAPCVECDIEPLKAENTALKEENERLMARVADLAEALESSQHGLHEECRCGQCKFVRLRNAALAAYRKGNKEGPSHDN